MDQIKDYIYYFFNQLGSIGLADVIDILIVAFLLYYVVKFVRDRRAGRLAIGVIIVVFASFLSEIIGLRVTNFLLNRILEVGLIALIIVFQPELRSMLEKMGESTKAFRGKLDKNAAAQYRNVITEICGAAESLSNSKTGALIVIECTTRLGDVIKTGTVLDAEVTGMLLGNIFFNKAPLHDGAVIIRKNRVYAAGCFLPLSTNPDIIKDLGTRHRAAIGMSENSDAVVIVVSEETGLIGVAIDGELKRGFTRKTLEEYLTPILVVEQKPKKELLSHSFFGGKDDGDDENKSL